MATPAPATLTPILDRCQPMPRGLQTGPRATFKALAFGAALGIVVGVAGAVLPKFLSSIVAPMSAHAANTNGPLLLLSIFVSLYAAIAIHEFGHFLAGLACGFEPNFVRFGPIHLSRDWKLSLHNRRGSGAGGMTSMLPPQRGSLRRGLVVLLLGGPAANLVSWAAILLIGRYQPLPGPLGVFAGVSSFLGIVNLVPFRYRAVSTDGRRIFMLLFEAAQSERWLSLLRLSAALARGARPDDLDPAVIAEATRLCDDSAETVAAHAIANSAAYWSHRDADAAQALETALRHSGRVAPATRESLIAAAAVLQARRRHAPAIARQWLADLHAKTQVPGLRLQAESAIAEADGDPALALRKLDEALHLVAALPDGVERDLLTTALTRWKSELSPG